MLIENLKPNSTFEVIEAIWRQTQASKAIKAVRGNRHIQGTSKERFPGCVKLDEKVAFCLPTAGRRRNLFHPKFTKPEKHSLEVPCRCQDYLGFWFQCELNFIPRDHFHSSRVYRAIALLFSLVMLFHKEVQCGRQRYGRKDCSR